METDIISSKKWNSKEKIIEDIQSDINNFKKIFYISIVLLFLLNIIIFSIIFTNHKKENNNILKNMNISDSIPNQNMFDDNYCLLVKNKLRNRTQPFDFQNEFIFFTDLISCKIPFSFIRFADCENYIMNGKKLYSKGVLDKWDWDPEDITFQQKLIESSSNCLNENSFIGIPCKNWIKISKSILSYSNCTSSKFMSYTTLFVNKNYPLFKDWIISFINSSSRWKIILVANEIINKNINWAYKFFPVPNNLIGNWQNFSTSLITKLSQEAINENLIFFISAGPAANIIISHLAKINNKNIYIDFGSAIEFITKGYTTRNYAKNRTTSFLSCESFSFINKSLEYIM